MIRNLDFPNGARAGKHNSRQLIGSGAARRV